MRIIFISLITLFLVGCAATTDDTVSSTNFEDSSSSQTTETSAELATNFVLPNLAGDEVSLDSFRGKYVLVNFWATWCVPCRKEMPYLQNISEKHSDQLVVLGINMGEDVERVEPFVEDMALTFPILLDPPDTLTDEHNVRGLPVSFIVGPDGQIIWRQFGEILPEEFDRWLGENL